MLMKRHVADMPMTGPGKGGKVGTNVTQHIMKSIMKDTMRDEDPRAAILRHAEDAEGEAYFLSFIKHMS